MDKIYAIIPVNQFANAKTRLSPFLSPEERKNLYHLKREKIF